MVVKSRAGVLYFYGTFDEHFVSFEIKHQATCVRYKQVKVVFLWTQNKTHVIPFLVENFSMKSNSLSGFELFTVVCRLKRRLKRWFSHRKKIISNNENLLN